MDETEHTETPEADAPAEGAPWPDDGIASSAEDEARALVLNIDGYEGPLDVLLDLARSQKVDLKKISILALVEQYLAFMAEAKAQALELAADYLVMAAWLTFLKTKLLLPEPEADDDEPTGEEMAARLAFQLQRLEAMRDAGAKILKLPRLGVDRFPRGAPEGVRVKRKTEWEASIYDLLKAYSDGRIRGLDPVLHMEAPKAMPIELARKRIEAMLGSIPDWSSLRTLAMFEADKEDAPKSSVMASSFNAALELVKEGRLKIRQTEAFGEVYIRTPEAQQPAAIPLPTSS